MSAWPQGDGEMAARIRDFGWERTPLGPAARWPERLKRHYIGYSYVSMIYCLPFFCVLVALQRGGGMPSVSNAFIVLCFLVLLSDWRNTLVMLLVGTAFAWGVYVLTTADPPVPVAGVLPDEGSTGWSDTWMMAKDAAHPNCMLLWMDHMMSAEANGQATVYFGEAATSASGS